MEKDEKTILQLAAGGFVAVCELRGQAFKVREGVAKSTGKAYRMAILEITAELETGGVPVPVQIEVMAPKGEPDIALMDIRKGEHVLVVAQTLTYEKGVMHVRAFSVGRVPSVAYNLKPAEAKKTA